MWSRGRWAVGVALAVLVVTACGDEAKDDPSRDTDAGGKAGAGGEGSDVGSTNCPTGLPGPSLVNVPAPAGSPVADYCMDATEVTNGHYAAFLDALPSVSGQHPLCSGNLAFMPWENFPGAPDVPVVTVDWCDAVAYCTWAGKRLCGKIGGGANAYDDHNDPTKSEWQNACSKGGTLVYPYGNMHSDTACVGHYSNGEAHYQPTDVPKPVGTPTCEGGYPGLFDLSGNVWEWEDSCDGATGAEDECLRRGGGVINNAVSCANEASLPRSVGASDVGFRCCSASL